MISTGEFRVVRRLHYDGTASYVIQEKIKFLFWSWWSDELWGIGTRQQFGEKNMADDRLRAIIDWRKGVDRVVTYGYV